ncbi:AAA family ATPase [Salmonella enterica]|nr:AAA family ATPase [Salmonella enterica]ELW6563841.1 AAA family ATPase [Salmonella enterica]ELZ1404868.1 AAA family ATPase [Salmonella enterica]
MSAAKKLPDAVLSCLYRWMQHNGELDKLTLQAAIKQTVPETPEGSTVRRLESMRGKYDAMFDAGYFNALKPEQAQKRRCELVAETMGADTVKEILTDERIALLFPATPPEVRKTRLPLSVGSDGFDRQMDYTIKAYLPANSLCSIYGPSGSYKSFLAVSWACHIAAGLQWSARSVASGSALYVVGEGGLGVPRRVRAWERTYNDDKRLTNLYLVNRPVFPVRSDEVAEVILAAKQVEATTGQPVRLIVIDTLARCFGGNDENDARDMGAFIEGCDTIKRETGATLLVVHHSGKDEGKGARGSSAFRAALDAEFNVRREGAGGALILRCTKMKDAEEPGQCAYDLKAVGLFTDSDGDDVYSLVVVDVPREARDTDPELENVKRLTDNHAALWQCIRSRKAQGEPCNRAVVRDDIIAMFGESGRKSFPRWLEKLVRDELIEVSENGDIVMTGKE